MLSVTQADEVCRALEGRLTTTKSARARVNRFILENLRDGFCAGHPRLVVVGQDPVWSVPILYARRQDAPIEVGDVLIQGTQGNVMGFTPPAQVYRNAGQ